ALSNPAAAESLNDLSPLPPMSYRSATFTAGLLLVEVPPVVVGLPPGVLLLHAAATITITTSGTPIRSDLLIHPPPPGKGLGTAPESKVVPVHPGRSTARLAYSHASDSAWSSRPRGGSPPPAVTLS